MRRRGHNRHTAPIVGSLRARHDAGLLAELATHLVNHLKRRAPHRQNGERAEQKRRRTANQQSDKHNRHIHGQTAKGIFERDAILYSDVDQLHEARIFHKRVEQRHRRHDRCGNREAFGERLRGVAH